MAKTQFFMRNIVEKVSNLFPPENQFLGRSSLRRVDALRYTKPRSIFTVGIYREILTLGVYTKPKSIFIDGK